MTIAELRARRRRLLEAYRAMHVSRIHERVTLQITIADIDREIHRVRNAR